MTLTLPGSGYDRNGYRIGGLGLAQEANVAKALGFVEASELDGGGSATAMVRRQTVTGTASMTLTTCASDQCRTR